MSPANAPSPAASAINPTASATRSRGRRVSGRRGAATSMRRAGTSSSVSRSTVETTEMFSRNALQAPQRPRWRRSSSRSSSESSPSTRWDAHSRALSQRASLLVLNLKSRSSPPYFRRRAAQEVSGSSHLLQRYSRPAARRGTSMPQRGRSRTQAGGRFVRHSSGAPFPSARAFARGQRG